MPLPDVIKASGFGSRPTAFGRKLPLISAAFTVPERPLLIKADIRFCMVICTWPSGSDGSNGI